MGFSDQILEAVTALFLIYIFGFVLLPAFGQATGQNTTLFTILYLIMGLAVVGSIIVAVMRRV